jgi:hypothetical protein
MDKLKQAKDYFDKAKPRSKGSAGRESAEKSRKKSVEAVAQRREKVAQLNAAKGRNPGFIFGNEGERNQMSKMQPGPKDYPEFSMDARSKRLMVPKNWSPGRNAEGGYFRGGTVSNTGDGFALPVNYPGKVMRYQKKK